MILETIESKGISHFSYLVGDQSSNTAAVIDPRRDVDIYLKLAAENNLYIRYIFETHIHADFISGSRELSTKTGAEIFVGAEGDYGFECSLLYEDDEIEIGELKLKVVHTPGHTPEHLCYLIGGGKGAEKTWGIFSGDTLFAGEIGRPDLLGKKNEKKLASQLFDSLHNKIFNLNDDLIVYPAHGKGSPCGASIGDRSTTTIGYEKRNNPVLSIENKKDFVEKILASQSPPPKYYPRMKKINAEGPKILNSFPYIAPLTPEDFKMEMNLKNRVVLDTREIEAFAGAHIKNSINIALRLAFPIWCGWILKPDDKLIIILQDETKLDETIIQLYRVGYEKIAGYLQKGFRSWIEEGYNYEKGNQISVHELNKKLKKGEKDFQLLDVRSVNEYEEGHIPAAKNIYVPFIKENMDKFNKQLPIITYCGSGFRSSIAASILRKNGFEKVSNIPGSFSAWKAAGFEVIK